MDQWGYAAADYPITYSISPAEYQALSAYVLIYKNGTVISTIPAGTKGTGTATISRGFWFDINSTYEAEVVLNKSTGVEIRSIKRSLPLDIQVKIITPPDNPNPSDSTFTTNYSYLSDSTVNAEATVGQIGNAAEISWDVTATLGGIWNENPANRMGPTFIFSLNPPAHPPYVQGTGCNDAGNGSCDRSNPLSYRIKAIYHSGSDENTITQDQLDIIRQEYVNHGLAVPIRGDFQVPYSTAHFTVAEIIGNNAYSVVLGTPGEFAEIIRDAYNRLINDDVQEIPVGTSGLDPLHIVVSPGANIQTIGPVLDTAPCNGAPNPTVCDDKYGILEEDGFMKDVIIAGPNGIAETVAVNQLTDYGLRISSAWRNPERNEAIGGVLTSRHQYGNADDLQHRNDASGKTSAQLYCILLTAAKGVANYAIAEQGATERACNDPLVDHIHAHN